MADGDETEFDFLSNVKLMLGISDDGANEILRLYVDITKDEILSYCNISELPSALNYTLCRMAADSYRDNLKNNSTGGVVGNVSSVSEDGRSVSFTNGSEIKTDIADRITRTHELNRYRKLYRI